MSDELTRIIPEQDSPQLQAAYEEWARHLSPIASVLIFGREFPKPPPWEDLSLTVRRNWATVNSDVRQHQAGLS